MYAVQLKNVTKQFNASVKGLDEVTAGFRTGEITVLLGLSGSGKSTMLRHINGLHTPTSGHVRVLGSLRGPRLSLMMYPKAVRAEAMQQLERVGLADRAFQRADTLSGGQKQRVAIARSLMQHPTILLADEPVAALDPVSSQQVTELLKKISREDGLTVIASLHQVQLAIEFADRIIGLRAGQIVLDRATAGLDATTAHSIYNSVAGTTGTGEDRSADHTSTTQSLESPL
ncbi:MAG TPA: ATP-binding cassette domain-containing protein [Candidatus Corynebacterium gallistercoris]|uniref:ATP-binding cassette domain-containing protein n=1 Tax=Candidatus Corynebacterium gallistercoris TaxID=2838530 RepID=A0A9D1RYU4_9CORY|nr:ATP-binding cassette domain-containing protein [Candidatus Corynebacterium gallistercoris]